MNLYSWVKLLHIISSTLMFGTGLGIAYFLLRAYLSGNTGAIRTTTRHAVLADWMFTTPSVVVQFATGMWLTWQLDISFDSAWFAMVLTLFCIAGFFWLAVLSIQARILSIINAGGQISACRRLLRRWIALGLSAFAAVLILFYLMVSKDGAEATFFT